MKFIRVTGFASMLVFGLSACGEDAQAVRTQEQLKALSFEEFATTICDAITNKNLKQLESNTDKKFFDQMQRDMKRDRFPEFVDKVDCSDVSLTEHTKSRKNFTIATFGGGANFRFAITKKDGFYSVIS